MPVCKITRATKSKCFQGEAGYSYCAAKDEKYYGFEGHIVISFDADIINHTAHKRDSVFTPLITLKAFIFKVLSADDSCKEERLPTC